MHFSLTCNIMQSQTYLAKSWHRTSSLIFTQNKPFQKIKILAPPLSFFHLFVSFYSSLKSQTFLPFDIQTFIYIRLMRKIILFCSAAVAFSFAFSDHLLGYLLAFFKDGNIWHDDFVYSSQSWKEV